MSSKRRFFGAAFAAFAAYVVALASGLGGPALVQAVSDLGILVGALAAAVACALAARRDTGAARRAWGLLAAASLSWAAGEAMWSFYELVLRREAPFPSLADIAYLGAIPLAAAAMLSFPAAPENRSSRIRALLDGLTIAGATLFVGWALVLGPLYRAGSGDLLGQVIGLAYPLGDVVLISLAIFVAATARRGTRAPLELVALALGSMAVADSGYTYLILKGLYSSGNLIDAGWMAGYLLLVVSALRPSRQSAGTGARPSERARAALPAAAVLAAVAAAAAEEVGSGALEPFLFWNAVAIVVLVLARQILTVLENHALTRNLEAKVQARTAELGAAVRDLEEAARLQERFVSNVSHELRTPLAAIIAAERTLLRPELGLSGEIREFVERAERSATRMSDLVESLLAASGIEDHTAHPRVVFDAAERLRWCLAGFRPRSKRLEAVIPDVLLAAGDPQRFDMIVEQLLSNADKFAPAGTRIHVRLESGARAARSPAVGHSDPASPNVCLTVADEGPGIPPALRERVFERFYQIDADHTRAHGGAGVGLHIARSLAELMGGGLVVEDSARGAVLRLTLAAPATSLVPAAPRDRRPRLLRASS
ncbi:MAG: HAMP domain-containing histidine kinase [Acidobacteria bacterium]|nr:HAMP domain-containing histidine kinase [Acidobacteriota bacterium]